MLLSILISYGCCNKFHKLVGLKHSFIILHFWRSELEISFTGPTSRCLQGHAPLEGSRGQSVSVSLPASRAPLRAYVGSRSLHLQSQQHSILPQLSHCLFLLFCSQISLCPLLIRTPVITFRVHVNNPG